MTMKLKRPLRNRPQGSDSGLRAPHVGGRRMLASCALAAAASVVAVSLTTTSAVFGLSKARPLATSRPELIVNFFGGAEIPFFAIIEKGVEAAAKDLGVNAVFQAPPCPGGNCSVVAQAQLLDSEIAAHPAAIAIQFNNGSLIPGIERALSAGIKMILVNAQNLPSYHSPQNIVNMAFIGQNEYTTGTPVAQNLAPLVPKGGTVVCINPGPSQIVQTIRCDSVKAALAADGISTTVLYITTGVASEGEALINGYLLAHPKTAGMVALGSYTLQWVCQIKEQRHLTLPVGGYDLSSGVASCIKSGEINFTLDQEPWLQGYMSVVEMNNWVKYGILPANVDSGATIVNKSTLSYFTGQLAQGIGG